MTQTPQTEQLPAPDLPRTSPGLLKRINRFGWVLFTVWAAVLVIWAIIEPDPYAQGWRLVLELAFLGRLVSISDGFLLGCSHLYLFVQSGPQDLILLFVVYPMVVRAHEGSSKKHLLNQGIEALRKSADKRKGVIEPFGVIGLWVFVFFPFWSTGALVGGVVGYLIGMRTRVIFASVLTGHFLSVVSLIWLFDAVYPAAMAFSESLARFLPLIVLGLLVALAIIRRTVSKQLAHLRERAENADDPE